MRRFVFLGSLLFSVLAVTVKADRWPALKPDAITALAESQGEEWQRNARERDVLPGAGPQGRERVRALATSTAPSSVALREALMKEARDALSRPISAYRTPEEMTASTGHTLFDTRQELWMRRVGDELVLFSLAAAITPDDAALRQRIHDLALAVCRYPQWGVREPNQDLAAGHVARGLAIAWSWNRGLWDEAEAGVIRETVRVRVNTLAAVMSGGIFWAGAYQENHNHVSAAAVGICGAAFISDLPDDAVRWLATAQLNFEEVARHANADGSSPEGVAYWSYGASYIFQYLEGVRGIVDVESLYAGDWLRNMSHYRMHAATSGLNGTVPWGDSVARDFYGPHHMLNLLAAHYRDQQAQYLAAHLPFDPQYGADVTAWNWLWHDPSVAMLAPESLDAHLPDIDMIDSRSGWGAGDYLIAIKSGFTNRNHSHLDAGALAFAFGGEWLLPAPGYGKGSGDKAFWDAKGGRWNYFSNATESHSTLLVNGKNQRFDPQARGTTRAFASTPEVMWTEIDLGDAYAGTKSIWRRVLHRRGDYAFVFDDVELAEAGRTEWLLQLPPSATIDGSEALVEGVSGGLAVRMIEPMMPFASRKPLSPKVDVPRERLKTMAVSQEGIRASFRVQLSPVFGGAISPAPVVKKGEGDRYVVTGEGWKDAIVFDASAPVSWTSDEKDVAATARLVLARHQDGVLADVFAADAVRLELPILQMTFVQPATVSVVKITDDLWVLDGFKDIPLAKDLSPSWQLYVPSSDTWISVSPSTPAGRLLVAHGNATMADYLRWQGERTALRDQPKLPVMTRAPLPVAPPESRIGVEAEAFSGQASGQVQVVTKPGNSGKSLRGFGNETPFHALSWKVTVPVAGTYRLRLRYCTAANDGRVSLLIDGSAPSESALNLPLPATGGWSVDADNWKDVVLASADGHPLQLPLTAGEHELRLTRPSVALNLDTLELIGGAE
ncbi:MAG: heparinase II/III family protein [Opitutaceae bacterium]|jgi:hypothetical protein